MSNKIMKKLEGKVALITGGNSGIGLAIAQRFVSEGAYVFITGRRQSKLDAAVKQIGRDITGVQSDVSNLEDLDRLYSEVKEQKDHIDIMFANAGLAESAPLEAITEAHFDKIFNVNVKGAPLYGTKGASILSGWRFDHSERVDRGIKSLNRVQCVWYDQGRRAIICTLLGRRVEKPEDTGQCH
jgi:NAD(P)-dependent dehydrogenase (short-subunit alcohol dehydrogenase family)